MLKDILKFLPPIGILLAFIVVYVVRKKIHDKNVLKSLLKWTNQHHYELIDFKLDKEHNGPFMYDVMDSSKKLVFIINYKDKDGKICSGYILYGQSGLNLSGNNVVFEPIEKKETKL